jgi:biotin transport system substrate-specific component
MAMYVGLGIAGVPWFNGGTGGLSAIAGSTGGYLFGFVLAAFFLGYVVDRYAKTRSFRNLFLLMSFADFVLVFGPGLLQLHLWSNLAGERSNYISRAFSNGAFSFHPRGNN